MATEPEDREAEDRDALDARDRQLIADCNHAELVAAYFPRILQILRLKRVPREIAEEIRQRVVEHLLGELRGGKQYSTPFRVVVYQRTKWKRLDYFEEQKKLPGELPFDPEESGPDAYAHVESDVGFERRIAGLPAREREVVDLRWRQGLEPKEIAEKLGIEANAVNQALHRALEKLRSTQDE